MASNLQVAETLATRVDVSVGDICRPTKVGTAKRTETDTWDVELFGHDGQVVRRANFRTYRGADRVISAWSNSLWATRPGR